jgi:hypothetical protein
LGWAGSDNRGLEDSALVDSKNDRTLARAISHKRSASKQEISREHFKLAPLAIGECDPFHWNCVHSGKCEQLAHVYDFCSVPMELLRLVDPVASPAIQHVSKWETSP